MSVFSFELDPNWALSAIGGVAQRGWLYDDAWWAGYFDGLADDYDCRDFSIFLLFTAYEKGRDAGIEDRGQFSDDDGPFQPVQLRLM